MYVLFNTENLAPPKSFQTTKQPVGFSPYCCNVGKSNIKIYSTLVTQPNPSTLQSTFRFGEMYDKLRKYFYTIEREVLVIN